MMYVKYAVAIALVIVLAPIWIPWAMLVLADAIAREMLRHLGDWIDI